MMKESFDKGLQALNMSVGDYIRFLRSTGNCNVKTLIDMFHIKFSGKAILEPKLYRFLDGPFKGSLFLCTSPDVRLMNEHPWFEVEFISGPCKGIKTSSLVTYDRKVISLEPTWRKLLSISQTTWLNVSVAGFQTKANKI
ncbi:hypothetical protein [Enterobacter phage vB-EclM_KMB20]|nr:hypothetical protein [Enterobacter phage vB-EclM_KMB20]